MEAGHNQMTYQQLINNDTYWNSVYKDFVEMYIALQVKQNKERGLSHCWIDTNDAKQKAIASTIFEMKQSL